MAEETKDTKKTEAKTYSETEYNALKQQLDDANAKIQEFAKMDVESIQKSADEWKQKFQQLEAQQKEKEYSDGLDKFVTKQNMKNDIYAAHLKQQLVDAQLKFDKSGVLIGGEDVVKKLREDCPDAFAPDRSEQAAAPTSGSFSETLSGVERAFYSRNPELKLD